MSVNIRNYVSNDHIESIGEIAKSQSAIIQALSLDNSKLEREIERLSNIINELEDSIVGKINVLYQVRGQSNAIQELSILLRQLRELKGSDKE